MDGAYSYFDFSVNDQLTGDRLVPNAADTKYNIGLGYNGDKLSGSLSYKNVDGFDWAAGIFVGPVPSYEISELALGYQLNDRFRLALNVSNLLDDEHYQSFGATVLGRKAQLSASFNF